MNETPLPLRVEGINDAILSSIPSGILVVDLGSKLLYMNREGEKIFGCSSPELLGRPLLFDARFRRLIALINEHRKSVPPLVTSRMRIEQEFTRPDGTVVPLGFSIASLANLDRSVLGYVIIFRDLSEIKLLQDRAKRAEAMASLGVLSAGVAHEIRNPLHAIRGAIELLCLKLGEAPGAQPYLDVMTEAIERADRIIQEVLDYAKVPRLDRRPVDVNASVRRHIELGDPSRTIPVVLDLMEGLPHVMADDGKIGQVLCNLLDNARDSIGPCGTIRVATSLDPGPSDRAPTAAGRGFVRIDVADDGPGIPPDDLPRVFDLFFTSGKGAKGTGLGLAISRKLVEAHNGFLTVASREGQGATFSIFLPVA